MLRISGIRAGLDEDTTEYLRMAAGKDAACAAGADCGADNCEKVGRRAQKSTTYTLSTAWMSC